MARERPAWACEQPEVAVCIVGQLRTASRPKLARNLRTAWDRVGADCVDLYLHVGLEGRVATSNHRAYPGASYENASTAAIALRPIEWRATTYPLRLPKANCTMDANDATARSSTVCQKRPSDERDLAAEPNCGHANCTHCSTSQFFPQADRIAACASMVMAAQRRMARPYRYFVFHRPDMWLYGIPRYKEWSFLDPGLARTALFCQGNEAYVGDLFGLVAYSHVSIFAGLGELYSRCQSKRENQAFGCQTSGWPQWHQSECIMKTAFNRRGVDTAKATMWASFLKSCRVIRDAGEKWR